MSDLSKVFVAGAAAVGLTVGVAALAHGPGFGAGQGGYGHGAGMMGPHGAAAGPGPCLGAEAVDARPLAEPGDPPTRTAGRG